MGQGLTWSGSGHHELPCLTAAEREHSLQGMRRARGAACFRADAVQ